MIETFYNLKKLPFQKDINTRDLIITNFNMDSADPAIFILIGQPHLRERLLIPSASAIQSKNISEISPSTFIQRWHRCIHPTSPFPCRTERTTTIWSKCCKHYISKFWGYPKNNQCTGYQIYDYSCYREKECSHRRRCLQGYTWIVTPFL